MIWSASGLGALHGYLRVAAGAADFRLLPTLLGLRAVGDPEVRQLGVDI